MTAAISIRNLQKTYANGFTALKGIDLEVEQGDFFALLGPNGAGKSTTIGVISSLVKKTQGDVSILGYDIDKDMALAKKSLGVVPQEFNFNHFEKVFDIVVNQAGYYGINRKEAGEVAETHLKQLGLWDKRSTQARFLSGGMKRRLMIARALVHQPKLLILDEPTAGVDIELRRSMWTFLRQINKQGTTIILTTHYLEEAESLCRNIAIIDQGSIVENTSIKALLSKLNRETFIFDSSKPVGDLTLANYDVKVTDTQSFEIELEKGQSMNDVFTALSQQSVEVISMRNKANRLEELFVKLVEANKKKKAAEQTGVSA
ncbi:ABC transporter ATP-binding protein [Sessilibacter sp. MAH2]